jgi:DNA helicase-2/ATP-dependent DNA helicase PcrA
MGHGVRHRARAWARPDLARLLYVALSRAERRLHLSWARERARGARVSSRTKSPFLTEVARVVADAAPSPTATDPGAGPSAARQVLAALEPGEIAMPDRALYDALVRWRRDLARAAAVPPYVILDNKTLQGVAAARPRSSDALLALPGIGPVKLERYGADLLEVVDQHRG